jgi:hypothetical protein
MEEEPDIEGPTRWNEEIKVYAHLYRRLQIIIPNVVSTTLIIINRLTILQDQVHLLGINAIHCQELR